MTEAFEAELTRRLAEARERFPGIDLAEPAFRAHVEERLPPGEEPVAALGRLCTADLYLARAAAGGDARALAELERGPLAALDGILARLGADRDTVAEVKQRLRTSLLVGGAERRPEIVDYRGRGSLAGWLRVVAIRMCKKSLVQARRNAGGGDGLVDALAARSVVGLPDGRRHRDELAAALRVALLAIGPDERRLLRAQVVEDLSVRDLARREGVHPATAARWLGDARLALATALRAELMGRLRIGRAEIDTLVRSVRSQVDVSLDRLLASG